MTQAVKNRSNMIKKEKTTSNNIKDNNIKTANMLEYMRRLLIGLLLAILFYPPYLRGLYFEREQLPTEALIFGLFCLYWVYKYMKKDESFLKTPIEYASFGLMIVYAIGIMVAAGLRLAILEWVKYCMYFTAFFMLSDLISTYKAKIVVIWTMITSALGVCILGIDATAGNNLVNAVNSFFKSLLSIDNDLFFAMFNDNRIYSTIQYPNALASYLMAVFFVTLGITVVTSSLWGKAVAGGINSIFLITLVLTQSRGAFIMFPAVILIYLLAIPTGKRIQGMAYLISTALPSTAIALVVSEAVTNPVADKTSIWYLVLVGMLVSGLLSTLTPFIVKRLEKIPGKVYAVLASITAIAGVAGILLVINTSAPLNINIPAGQEGNEVKVKKSLVLAADKEYKLVFDIGVSSDTSSNTATYNIDIASRNEKDILFYTETVLNSYEGNSTNGIEKREIPFKVPGDSKIVDITLRSSHPGMKAEFNNGVIIDTVSGKIADKLVLSYKYLPDSIASRFEDIAATRNVIERGIFYRDGFNIVKDRWLLGAGGGAWSLLYFQHQSYAYPTTQAHNYFLQVAVETGIIGIVSLLLLIISILVLYLLEYRIKRENDSKERFLQAVLFTGIASMFMHSAVDFDLSLSAVYLLLWQMIGLFNSRCRNNSEMNPGSAVEYARPMLNHLLGKLNGFAKVGKLKIHPIIGIIVSAVIAVLPISIASAAEYRNKAIDAVKNNNIPDAINHLKRAVSADPFNPLHMVDYANLVVSGKNISQQSLQEANRMAERADKISKFNYFDDSVSKMEVLPLLAQYYFSTAETEKGLDIIRRNNALRPLWPEKWQERVNGYLAVILYNFKQNSPDKALQYIDQALEVLEDAKTVNRKNMNPFIFNEATQEMLEKMKYVKEYVTRQSEINIDKVVFYNMPEMDVNEDAIPDQWTPIALTNVKHDNATNCMVIEGAVAGQAGIVQSRNLTFLPGKKYVVEIEINNLQGISSMPFTVTGISEINEGLKPAGNVFRAEIITQPDFKRGNNVLRLIAPVKLEIKSAKVVEK